MGASGSGAAASRAQPTDSEHQEKGEEDPEEVQGVEREEIPEEDKENDPGKENHVGNADGDEAEGGAQIEKEEQSEKNEASSKGGDSGALEGDCKNLTSPRSARRKLEKSAWSMLRNLKMIDHNVRIVEQELQRVQNEMSVYK